MQLGWQDANLHKAALFLVGKGCPAVVIDFKGEPGSQNLSSVCPCFVPACSLYLHKFGSSGSLNNSLSYRPTEGSPTFSCAILTAPHAGDGTRGGDVKNPWFCSQFTLRFGMSMKHPERGGPS